MAIMLLFFRNRLSALCSINLLGLCAILFVSLSVVPRLSFAANANNQVLTLKNNAWTLFIQPSTLEIKAQPQGKSEFFLSLPQEGLGSVRNQSNKSDQTSWEFPESGITFSIQLKDKELEVQIQSKDPGAFTWPIIKKQPSLQALIWPRWEGCYIPLEDPRWTDYLVDYGGWDSLEGLTMPFWGLDWGDFSLTYILTNRYNNEIQFKKMEQGLEFRFTHEFPPNHAPREYGFIISLGENKTPVEPAQKFRKWLIDQGEFVSMKEKMAKTPKVERLLGAPHIYLWGDAYLSKQNVQSPKSRWAKVWKPFTKQMIEESKSEKPTVGKRIKELMSEKQWTDLIIEMAKVPYDYEYLQKEICLELSRLLGLSDFYDEDSWKSIVISDEAKELLARDRSSLSAKELARMNGLLLQAAFPDYLVPVDQWGDAVSVQMLKEMKDAGFERLRICLDGWGGIEKRPEVAIEADKMGYLFGTYDSFHSIHPPQWEGTDSTWPTAQFNQGLYETGGITRKDGTKKKGFKQKGYNLSPLAARPYVEERVNRNFKNVPYNYYFVDCDAYGQVFDDYTPGRVVTQYEDAMARNDRLAWICDTHHAVIGSEGGSSYSAPAIHVAEGMFLPAFGWGDEDLKNKESEYFLGNYYPPDGPAVFFKPASLKEKYRYFYFDPRFRLPLYETVFHDSVVTANHWSYDNLKFPDERNLVFLTQLLYQVPPTYHVNTEEFKKRKDIMQEQYDFFSPLHRKLGFSQMSDFAWLSEDHLIQKSVFDDKVEIVANFAPSDFLYQEIILPGNSLLVRWKDTGKIQIFNPGKTH